MRKILLYLCLLAALPAVAQEPVQEDWRRLRQFNFGVTINLHYGKGQMFPGIRGFAGLSIGSVYKEHLLLNYGAMLSVYTKSIGNNLNPLINDLQVDLINTFGIGGGGNRSAYPKFFRTMGPTPAYNASLDLDYAGMIFSNFILNNNGRNQVGGTVTVTHNDVTGYYYNDGSFLLGWGFGDNFDRWWTGSGGVFVHNKHGYNAAELTFDQFTGYSPLAYELSTLLGVNVPSYNLDEQYVSGKKKKAPNYNTSTYHFRYFLAPGYGVDLGVMGALRGKNGWVYAVQDMIHTKRNMALHPNTDISRLVIGGTYNNLSYIITHD